MHTIVNIIFLGLLLQYINFLMKIIQGLKIIESTSKRNKNEFTVSVIIPFRNESKTIIENLKCLENQNFSKDRYEVLYINDNSSDDSFEKLQKRISKSNIFIYTVDNEKFNKAHKKRAVEFGIEKAKGEIVLLTDADCKVGPNWINRMIQEFDDNTGLVSGPVSFNSKEALFERVQQLEFAGLVLSGAGLIGYNSPIICSSANLAFKKSVYVEVGGHKNLMEFSSGDDELLMQKIARDTDYKINFCFNKDALVHTLANKDLHEFTQQRKRWASKSLYYQNKKIVAQLILIFLFYVGLLTQLFIGIIWDINFLLIFLASFITKIILEYVIIQKGLGLLLDKISMKIFLISEMLHIPYIIYSGISGVLGNFTWKDRELKR